MKFQALFKPLQVGRYQLAHRVVMAPLTRMRAERETFAPRALNAEYYGQRATKGGLIIAEASPVLSQGRGNPATPGIYSEAQVSGWRKVVDAVHAKGGVIFLQLWHVGRVSHSSLLPDGAASYESVLHGGSAPISAKITLYVEHPVPLPPPGEAPPPPPQPLKLTAREQKKLRTQRRVAKEKERQEMLRQGLLEPPPPKVRIANLMRVLGAEATADPTAVEKEVRAQMAERAAAHEDRNAARALTPAERREKAARRRFEDAHGGGELQCAVFRVERIDHPLNEYKILLNAEENHLTGCGLKTDAFALVVVEGARKAIARYTKLMTRRMNWGLRPERRHVSAEEEAEAPGSAAAAEAEAEAAEAEEAARPNKCTLVWSGAVRQAAFRRFKFEPIRSPLVRAATRARSAQQCGAR